MSLLRTVAALAVVAALVAGCGDDDPKVAPPEKTTSATQSSDSTSPTPSEDALTEPPKTETAKQFIKRWIALGDRMQTTGDTDGFVAITGPDCRSCQSLVKKVQRIYREGGSIKTRGSKVVRARHDGGDQWTVELEGEPTTYRNSQSGATKHLPGGPYTFRAFIAKVDGKWVLADYSVVPQ